jgi:hypothetical protein
MRILISRQSAAAKLLTEYSSVMAIQPSYEQAIVGNAEFDMLSLIPDYTHVGTGCLTRLEGDKLYITFRQSEWDHFERLIAEVVSETAAASIDSEVPELPALNAESDEHATTVPEVITGKDNAD